MSKISSELSPKVPDASLETSASASEPPKPRAVTFRAVTLGLLLLPINAFWVDQMEQVRYSAHPTTVSLFFNCIFILVVLTGLNSLVARCFGPRRAFSQGELVLIYSMLCIGSCLGGHDTLQVLTPSLVWPYAKANESNGYAHLLWPNLPKWALMSDTDAAKGFFLGHDTLYTRAHLMAWLPPVLIWTTFIGVLFFVMLCLNVLIRKQWTDYEKLTYPLTKIPLEITDNQPFGRGRNELPLTKNRLFWLGFVLAASIDLVNSLNYYFPGIPAILTPGNGGSYYDLHAYITNRPWNAVGWMPASFYPFMVGIGMLMPMDFLFSSWFFYLIWKLQSVIVVANAWDADSRMPYANYQGLGAYMLFFFSTLWLSRQYLANVLRCALGKPSAIDDSDEPMRYRWALIGMVGGLTALIAFSVALGMAWWLAIIFFFIYFALALAITRMRAELGTPVHDLHFTGPDWTLGDLVGSRALGPGNLSVFTLFFWFNRAYRGHPMPFQLEGFKMAEQTTQRQQMRAWLWVLLLAAIVGSLSGFWAVLHNYYVYGGDAKITAQFGGEAYDRFTGWLKQPQGPNSRVAAAIVVGFLFATFLQAMRVRFAWWPFHPLAYAVSGTWEMNLLWMPLLIAWVIKAVLLRYGGGVKTYRAALPFFYGLILGQFIPGSLLNIWGIVTKNPTYQFWQ